MGQQLSKEELGTLETCGRCYRLSNSKLVKNGKAAREPAFGLCGKREDLCRFWTTEEVSVQYIWLARLERCGCELLETFPELRAS